MASADIKIIATLQAVIVFLLVSIPFTYKLTNGLLGGIFGKLADGSGCPTTLGLIVHSIVYGLIVYGLMHIKL
jgi:hypothetical protein